MSKESATRGLRAAFVEMDRIMQRGSSDARKIVGPLIGEAYAELERLEKIYGFTPEEIFSEQIAKIQTMEKGA